MKAIFKSYMPKGQAGIQIFLSPVFVYTKHLEMIIIISEIF